MFRSPLAKTPTLGNSCCVDTKTLPANVPSFEQRHRMALALEWAGVSNDEMAAEIGKGTTTVRNYLAGRTKPGRAILRVWALRCGVPFAWLEHGNVDLTDGPDTPTLAGPPPGWFTAGSPPRLIAVPDAA